MANYLINDTQLTSVADAIRAKSGGSAGLAFPSGFISEIGNIPTGGGSSGPITGSDVRFYDYDGTLFAGYSAADFAELTEMPANPSHVGLTAQGWNWSLANAKTYVAKYGQLNIGQMYITDDGKTRIYIHLEKGRTSPILGVCPNGTVDVDWGDGTAHNTLTGTSTGTVQWTPTHNYTASGDYVIKLTVTGKMGFSGASSSTQGACILRYSSTGNNINYAYRNAVKKIEMGNGIRSINANAFYKCYSLTNVIISNSITNISTSAFSDCSSLTNIIIPDGVTSIDSDVFFNCHSLINVIFPDGITNISSSAFNSCDSLTNVTIPDSVPSIYSTFSNCHALSNAIIPDSITNIGSNVFNYCHSLINVTIPDSITKIDSNAFYNCYSLAECHLLSTTPPSLTSTSAFTNISADCIIYVPRGSLEAYQTATNWSEYASHMQEEPQ